jgi:hypothetical protein
VALVLVQRILVGLTVVTQFLHLLHQPPVAAVVLVTQQTILATQAVLVVLVVAHQAEQQVVEAEQLIKVLQAAMVHLITQLTAPVAAVVVLELQVQTHQVHHLQTKAVQVVTESQHQSRVHL